jgi:hypothetical protein
MNVCDGEIVEQLLVEAEPKRLARAYDTKKVNLQFRGKRDAPGGGSGRVLV